VWRPQWGQHCRPVDRPSLGSMACLPCSRARPLQACGQALLRQQGLPALLRAKSCKYALLTSMCFEGYTVKNMEGKFPDDLGFLGRNTQ